MDYKTTADPKAWADGVPVFCAHDKIVDPAALIPNPKNPNTHPDSQIQLLGRVIRGNGWRQPITVSNRSGFIVKGHGRLAAALLEGFKAVPVDYQNYASEAEEYADLVADNRLAELAELDRKALADIFNDIDFSEMPVELTGYTEDEAAELAAALNDALEDELKGDPDEVPEPPEPQDVVTQLGDLWQIGRHRLLCGDSTDRATVERLMDGERADMVFTDPPYGIDVVKGNKIGGDKAFGSVGGNNIVKASEYIPIKGDDTTETAKKNYQIISELSDNQIIFGGNYFTDFLPPKACWVIWDKENTGNFADVEMAWTSLDKGAKLYKWLWNGLCRKGDRLTEGVKRVHPTQKPVGLIADILNDFTERNELILDCFGGSGSTLIACEQTGRKCLMIEYEPHYCDVIVRRYIRTTGNTADIHLIREGKEIDRAEYAAIFEE